MAKKKLDYHSREYDECLDQARRIAWNDDKLNSTDLENSRKQFNEYLNLTYCDSDEVERIKRALEGSCY